MKTSKRIRPICSAAMAARQVKTPLGKTVTVIFYSPDDDKELFRTDFPERMFTAIKRGAKTLGVGLDKFFELAILHKLRKAGIDTADIVNYISAKGGAQ
jgi:hypothetical protein